MRPIGKSLNAAGSKIASRLLPAQRRWRQLQLSCTLTPGEAQGSAPAGSVIICGCPRSGTSLMTAALFQPPSIITVMEPWDGLRLHPRELFYSLRRELESGKLQRGRLRLDLLRDNGAVVWQPDGERVFDVGVATESLIAVKWPTYWQLLGRVSGPKFVVCVRDPAEVVRSFEQQGGRLAQGLDYAVAFNSDINKSLQDRFRSEEDRRIGLYDMVNEHVLRHRDDPNVFVAHYERWFDDRSGLLNDLSSFLGVDVVDVPVKIRPPASTSGGTAAAQTRFRSTTAAALGYQ